jgi:hypothetical protein
MAFAGKYHPRTSNITNDNTIERILDLFVWIAMFSILMLKMVTKN